MGVEHAGADILRVLGSFHNLQFLVWYTIGEPTEIEGVISFSLPKLERLQLQGHAVFRALSLLRAPLLHRAELMAYPSEANALGTPSPCSRPVPQPGLTGLPD